VRKVTILPPGGLYIKRRSGPSLQKVLRLSCFKNGREPTRTRKKWPHSGQMWHGGLLEPNHGAPGIRRRNVMQGSKRRGTYPFDDESADLTFRRGNVPTRRGMKSLSLQRQHKGLATEKGAERGAKKGGGLENTGDDLIHRRQSPITGGAEARCRTISTSGKKKRFLVKCGRWPCTDATSYKRGKRKWKEDRKQGKIEQTFRKVPGKEKSTFSAGKLLRWTIRMGSLCETARVGP